jgi:hypothetical protein
MNITGVSSVCFAGGGTGGCKGLSITTGTLKEHSILRSASLEGRKKSESGKRTTEDLPDRGNKGPFVNK